MLKKKMSLTEAKELFRSYECSIFVMARENSKGYEEYKKLNIPNETELEWKSERLVEYSNAVKSGSTEKPIWQLINKMSELASSIKSGNCLKIVYEIIKTVMIELDAKDRVIISETINGRKHKSQRSGLIYLSFDIGEKSLAKKFALLSHELINLDSVDENLINRVKNSKLLCDGIMKELSI